MDAGTDSEFPCQTMSGMISGWDGSRSPMCRWRGRATLGMVPTATNATASTMHWEEGQGRGGGGTGQYTSLAYTLAHRASTDWAFGET